MKTKKILASMALCLTVALSLFFLSSFKDKGAKPCDVTCTFTAGTSTISSAGIDNCSGVQSTTGITSTYSPSLNQTSCSYIDIFATVIGMHAPGAFNVYKNGVLIDTWPVGTNQNGGFDKQYDATCGDHFDVTW